MYNLSSLPALECRHRQRFFPGTTGNYLERVAKSTHRLSIIPLLFWVLLAPLCVQSIKDPSEMSGLKGGDAQFNQTFGCLCVQCHVPPFQRNDILRKTVGRNHPLWSEASSSLCTCARSTAICTEVHFWAHLKHKKSSHPFL